MANLPAVSTDGVSIVYIAASGAGTNQDPFVVTNALPSGTVIGLDSTSLAALENITATISGTVPISGTVNTGLNPLTDAQLRATAVPVSGTFWQSTQPVSLSSVPLATDAATATNQATIIGHVDGIETALAGTLTVSVSNLPATQPISAVSLPLPDGSATSANQSTIIGHVDGIETALAGTLTVNTGLSPLTDAQLRASAVPVSLSSAPLATGAATSANQSTIIGHIDGIETALAGTIKTSLPSASSATILAVATAATGTNWTAFTSTACNALDIVNNSGTTIEYRRGATGTAMQIPDKSARMVIGITNANQIDVRRVDASNTQVTIQAEAFVL